MNNEEMELLGVSDQGKWLPFAFLVDIVIAIKLANDDEQDSTYNCTTVFTANGETYVIDTPFHTFKKIWDDFMFEEEKEEDDQDLVL